MMGDVIRGDGIEVHSLDGKHGHCVDGREGERVTIDGRVEIWDRSERRKGVRLGLEKKERKKCVLRSHC